MQAEKLIREANQMLPTHPAPHMTDLAAKDYSSKTAEVYTC